MADQLYVEPVAMQLSSDRMVNAVGDAAVSFIGHEDDLAAAAPGWIGASQQALAELAARWEAQHTQHKLRVSALNQGVIAAGLDYATNEDDSARALKFIAEE